MPNPTTQDADTYCTHSELADETGGARALAKLVPPDADAADPTALVRAQAVRDVFKALLRRTPPITEAQVSNATQLKDAVCYGALMRLYRAAMTKEGDKFSILYRDYKGKFGAEIQGMRITSGGSVIDGGAVTVFRR